MGSRRSGSARGPTGASSQSSIGSVTNRAIPATVPIAASTMTTIRFRRDVSLVLIPAKKSTAANTTVVAT